MPVDRVPDMPSGHSVGREGGCSILFMGRALQAVVCVTVTALLAAACGTNDDTASPDPIDEPVATSTPHVTAEPSPATPDPADEPVATSTPHVTAEPSPATPDPTIATSTEKAPAPTPSPEPTLYAHQSGLACYGRYLSGWEDEIDYDQAVGFPTLEEAATDWWQNASEARWWHERDGSSSISADDLTQSPPTSPPKGRGSAASGINPEDQPTPPPTAIYYRDGNGNAQIVIYGYQLDNGNWIIWRGESCNYMMG